MSEMKPDVLVGLPDYRPVDLGFDYIDGLQRSLYDAKSIRLNDPARQYVDAELAAARLFTSLALMTAVEREETATVVPLWLTEEILGGNHCLERRTVTCHPLPLPSAPGKFAVLQQVHYLLPYRGGKRTRCLLPMVNIFQHDVLSLSPPQLTDRYARPDVQFLDGWVRGVRGTPFFASCSREHLAFRETLSRKTPYDREEFDRKVDLQKQYLDMLKGLTEPKPSDRTWLPLQPFEASRPEGTTYLN